MIPQLDISKKFVVVIKDELFFVVFSLQLPWESHTISFVSHRAPGALQSICGKLGNCPLFGLLFHCAVTEAIKQNNASKISLCIIFLFASFCRKFFFLFHFVLFTFERLEKLKVSERFFFVEERWNYYVVGVLFLNGFYAVKLTVRYNKNGLLSSNFKLSHVSAQGLLLTFLSLLPFFYIFT